MSAGSEDRDSRIAAIKTRFTRMDSGIITDSFGKRWLLWDAEVFAAWWRKLGDITDKALGRRLAFAALEVEKSILQEQLPRYKFRHARKSWQNIASRWHDMGWGIFHLDADRITIRNSLNDALSAGLISAAAEFIAQEPLRMRWEGSGSNIVHVIHTKERRSIPNPAPLESLEATGNPLSLEISKSDDGFWEIEGRRSFLIPYATITELAKSCDCQSELTRALFEVFFDSMDHIIFDDNWNPLFEQYLAPMGHEVPSKSSQDKSISTFELPESEFLAVGIIQACWERNFGRPSQVTHTKSGSLIISPKHEIVAR